MDPATPHLTTVGDHSPDAVVHTALGSSIAAALMGWLPQALAVVAAMVGAIYYCICIYESTTVQKLLAHHKARQAAKRHARKRAKQAQLRDELATLEAELNGAQTEHPEGGKV